MLPKTASTLHSGPPVSSGPSPLLELRGVTKRFLGVQALDKVDFDLRSGEVHALFGENGAGKSTIINIICGTFPADKGSMASPAMKLCSLMLVRRGLWGSAQCSRISA